MMAHRHCLLWLSISWLMAQAEASFKLRVMRVQMSDEEGAGMDSGFLRTFGGGAFEMKICTSDELKTNTAIKCCHTGHLNTAVNNWERGQQNFFIGRQLGGCENFELDTGNFTSIEIQHSGSDGAKIDWIKLRGSNMKKNIMNCPVGQKLDNSEHYIATCQKSKSPTYEEDACNGRKQFCDKKFNKFTFPGAHNAGTGQKDNPNFSCFYKNHDLNVREQLDFGLRFLDLDVIYNEGGNCNGLETGHGAYTFLYQCMGSLKHYFQEVKIWMEENKREVVIIHLGELKNRDEAIDHFQRLLSCVYPSEEGINTQFQKTGEWPTLGEAISSKKRLFVMVKFKEDELIRNDDIQSYIKVLKVEDRSPKKSLPKGTISMISAYKSGYVGDNCIQRVQMVEKKCQELQADFVKVPAYGTLTNDAICLHHVAEECNSRIPQILTACTKHKHVVNFVFADYPNYLGVSHYTLPEITENENVKQED